jgi:hypothetical protein
MSETHQPETHQPETHQPDVTASGTAPTGMPPAGTTASEVRQAAPRRSRRRGLRLVPGLVAALAFVFAPVGVAVFGVHAKPLENRPLADKPSLRSGWKVFDETSAYVTDHLPIRTAAVDAHGAVVRSLFRQPVEVSSVLVDGVAYPRVVAGKNRWLYYGGDFQNTCSPKELVKATVDRLERVAELLRESGREVAVVVAPDKSTVVSEQLPDRYIGRLCSTERKSAFWKEYDRRGGDLLDVRGGLERAMGQEGTAYLQSDSHWTPRGGLVFAERIVRHLDRDAWRAGDLKASGTFRKTGDLGPLLLEERTDAVPDVVRATGWTKPTFQKTGRYDVRYRQPARETGLVRGRTTLIGDSFTFTSREQWLPWFADVSTRHRLQSNRKAVMDAVLASDNVVIEAVERDVASGRNGVLDDRFVAELQRRLSAERR